MRIAAVLFLKTTIRSVSCFASSDGESQFSRSQLLTFESDANVPPIPYPLFPIPYSLVIG
jgi:hypothetical protein